MNTIIMAKETVVHQSLKLSWIKPIEISQPQTLVLGSFNPFENFSKTVDYYYGRGTNHFWKAIAQIINKDQDYFFNNQYGLQRKKEIMQNRFCCLDVINSIDFESQNLIALSEYLSNNIFSNYQDQKIWTSKTKYTNNDIFINRNYNYLIIDFLKSSNSINKVIQTMGNKRISDYSTNPKEKNKGKQGFVAYINTIKDICTEKNISFVKETYSPSNYAVNNGSTNIEELKRWLKINLNL